MEYLLTEDEYEKLTSRLNASVNEVTSNIEQDLQMVCTMVAEKAELPSTITFGSETTVNGCPLRDFPSNSAALCDDCLAKDLCPSKMKRWSK